MKKPLNQYKINHSFSLGLAALLTFSVLPVWAGKSPLPGNATAYGKNLAQWEDTYWRWAFGSLSTASDAHGNAIVNGVVLLALPAAPGDGTPASIHITLSSGEPFMLPLWNLLGNTYQDGSSDPIFSTRIFKTLDVTCKIDGVTVITPANVMQYYTAFPFEPPIPFNFPPAVSFSYSQNIGFVHTPLTPGAHTLQLDVKNTDSEDVFGLVFEYHNTWHITVLPDQQ